jgi:hypothetical protein
MDKDKVIDVETLGTRDDVLKRRLSMVKDIAKDSALIQIRDVKTFQWAAGIGLYQGLKYRGSLKQGLKAGVATIVVVTGCNIISNVINKIDDIRKA